MKTKLVEIRDKATFIPAIATLIEGWGTEGQERYLLARAGYGGIRCVMLCRLDADGSPRQASYDPYRWGRERTMGVAHAWMVEHWEQFESGAMVDVEYILGETKQPKVSEAV